MIKIINIVALLIVPLIAGGVDHAPKAVEPMKLELKAVPASTPAAPTVPAAKPADAAKK